MAGFFALFFFALAALARNSAKAMAYSEGLIQNGKQ
jgi:hypothetical protein